MCHPRLYTEHAAWWPLLSAPADYEEEALFYARVLADSCAFPPRTLLELGSGAGNNASYLKADFDMTLVDLSPGMLEVSRALNPECEHLEGDMRSVRLDREFDCVFIHDAIVYMRTEDELRAAIETASAHCRSGGAVLLVPDHLRETFVSTTGHGGQDGERRSLRYLQWEWDPDPTDTEYVIDFVYMLRQGTRPLQVECERHHAGLFPRDTWLDLMRDAGLATRCMPLEHSEIEPGTCEVFVGRMDAGRRLWQ